MFRKRAAPPKDRKGGKQPEPEELKKLLRDAELKKFDPELLKVVRRPPRKPER